MTCRRANGRPVPGKLSGRGRSVFYLENIGKVPFFLKGGSEILQVLVFFLVDGNERRNGWAFSRYLD